MLFSIMIFVFLSCEKVDSNIQKEGKTAFSESKAYSEQSGAIKLKKVKSMDSKTSGEQIKFVDGDKTLYIEPDFADPFDISTVTYGPNDYNYVSSLTKVNGVWITYSYCEGEGKSCGYVYNDAGEKIGVYYCPPQ